MLSLPHTLLLIATGLQEIFLKEIS